MSGLIINPYAFAAAAVSGARKAEITLGDWKGDGTALPDEGIPVCLSDQALGAGHEIWSLARADGNDLRAYLSFADLTVPLPLDKAHWDRANKECKLRTRIPSALAVGASWALEYGDPAKTAFPAADDATIGSRLVYQDELIASNDLIKDETDGSSLTLTGGVDRSYGADALNKFGARGFHTTWGVADTDGVKTKSFTDPTQRSLRYLIYPENNISSDYEFWLTDGDMIVLTSGGGEIEFYRRFTTTDGRWRVSVPPTGAWVHQAFVHDAGAVGNDLVAYFDGVSQTVTENTAPVGTFDPVTGQAALGNRSQGLITARDAMQGEVRLRSGLMSADAILAEAKNFQTPAAFWAAGAGQAA